MAKRGSGTKWLLVPAFIGAYLAVGHPHASAHGITAALADVAATPAGTGSAVSAPVSGDVATPAGWAGAFLADAGFPRTTCNVNAVVAWQNAEGTHAEFLNPLDTTEDEPGAYSVNSVGVKHYPSWGVGLHATIVTLFNGHYAPIIAALRAGNNAWEVGQAVGETPWGTGRFPASC